MVKKANLDVVRENNRKLVLQTLFNSEKTSRSSISKAVGLQKSTVSSIFLDLEEEGFVQGGFRAGFIPSAIRLEAFGSP